MSSPPNFAAWNPQTLANFAHEAYLQLQMQHDLIQQLQCERKDAIDAYRSLARQLPLPAVALAPAAPGHRP
jgi:hypothetical protein